MWKIAEILNTFYSSSLIKTLFVGYFLHKKKLNIPNIDEDNMVELKLPPAIHLLGECYIIIKLRVIVLVWVLGLPLTRPHGR